MYPAMQKDEEGSTISQDTSNGTLIFKKEESLQINRAQDLK